MSFLKPIHLPVNIFPTLDYLVSNEKGSQSNLRARRIPQKPWEVENRGVRADVRARTTKADPGAQHFELQVSLKLPEKSKLIDVKIFKPKAGGAKIKTRQGLEVLVAARAPARCSPINNRIPIKLWINYLHDNKKQKAILEVDHTCLLGDFAYHDFRPSAWGDLVRADLHDPAIEKLVRRAAPLPVLSPEKEIERLRTWIGFSMEENYVPDPMDLGIVSGEFYALSPTETLRLGGDCEDWSILASAFLTRRGIPTKIVETVGHVWARALSTEGKWVEIDLVSNPEEGWEVLSEDLIVKNPSPAK